jgi:hypothetical protein
MQTELNVRRKLERAFPGEQASVLAEVITDAYSDLVKTGDFNELKGIVRELSEAQKGTELRMEELAEAQKRTELRMEELAEAQKRTELRMEELAEAQKETENELRLLAMSMRETRQELGGLSRSVSYGFENEAYRMLPAYLKNTCGIEIEDRLIRTETGGREINILGRAKRDGRDVIIIGEAKLRLDDRRKRNVFDELEEKVDAARRKYGDLEIIRLLVTHYATKAFMREARERGVLVIQSFEWC